MLAIIHRNESDVLSRVEGNIVCRKGWKSWWGQEFEDWDENWRTTEGNGTRTGNNCGKLRAQLRWDQECVGWGGVVGGITALRQQGKPVFRLSENWSSVSKESNLLKKKKIVAGEWLRWWSVVFGLEMEPVKVKMTRSMEPRGFAAVAEDYRE